MAKEEALSLTGKVVKIEKNGFLVECSQVEGSSHIVRARLSGKLRKNYIRIVEGDEVDVEVSPYDTHMGRITYRKK
jgi:translation initiation factor IF-1